MGLAELLTEKKSAILKRWFEQAVETYPPDTSKFIKSQKDPFANPVGHTTQKSLKGLLDCLTDEPAADLDPRLTASILDPMIRIRSIQDFTASRAVSIIFDLKKIVRKMLVKEIKNESRFANDLLIFESKVDKAALIAFDCFVACREKIYELKANEMRNRNIRAFERAGLIGEVSTMEPRLDEPRPR
jgi:hypothetical protein